MLVGSSHSHSAQISFAQHWHIYRKFNERLFKEMYLAYQQGRMGADPSAFWYKGELGFFDNYICPLARKLNDCKVFGVSSDVSDTSSRTVD